MSFCLFSRTLWRNPTIRFTKSPLLVKQNSIHRDRCSWDKICGLDVVRTYWSPMYHLSFLVQKRRTRGAKVRVEIMFQSQTRNRSRGRDSKSESNRHFTLIMVYEQPDKHNYNLCHVYFIEHGCFTNVLINNIDTNVLLHRMGTC